MAVAVSPSITFSIEVIMAIAYTVGRFQPPTVGHAKLIKSVMDAGEAFVFVSSAKPCGKEAEKNPLTSAQKIKYLNLMFPSGVTFVDTAACDPACGGPLAAYKFLKERYPGRDIVLVAGSDRAAAFGPTAAMWKETGAPKFKGLDREAADAVSQMSGTKARALAKNGDLVEFKKAVMREKLNDANAEELYTLLRSTKGGGNGECVEGEDVSVWAADDESGSGGRRRRTRRRVHRKRSRRNR